MELIKVENGVLSVEETAIKLLVDYHEAKVKFDIAEQELKEAILQAMEESGNKKYSNDNFSIDYIDSYERSSVDTAKMKEEGIYDDYVKKTKVKPSVKITWK